MRVYDGPENMAKKVFRKLFYCQSKKTFLKKSLAWMAIILILTLLSGGISMLMEDSPGISTDQLEELNDYIIQWEELYLEDVKKWKVEIEGTLLEFNESKDLNT